MIRITPPAPRTTLPIQITVPSGEHGKLLIRPTRNAWSMPIELALTPGPEGRQAQFWAEREGSYEAVFVTKTGTEVVPFEVVRQHYLSFREEFGWFFFLWILVMIGIILGVRRVRWKEKSVN